MVLGAVWCPLDKKVEAFNRIKEIKKRHGYNSSFEIKWNKVSPAKVEFYLDILDYFFDDDDLHFRSLIIPNKNELDHKLFDQTHDEFYYKMFFDLLKVILNPRSTYQIFLDYKDTRSQQKINKLFEVLCNSMYDFKREIIKKIQPVCSKEVQLIQLTDLLTGIIAYENRDLTKNAGKLALVSRMKIRSGYNLRQTTLLLEEKVNIFRWKARGGNAFQ